VGCLFGARGAALVGRQTAHVFWVVLVATAMLSFF